MNNSEIILAVYLPKKIFRNQRLYFSRVKISFIFKEKACFKIINLYLIEVAGSVIKKVSAINNSVM